LLRSKAYGRKRCVLRVQQRRQHLFCCKCLNVYLFERHTVTCTYHACRLCLCTTATLSGKRKDADRLFASNDDNSLVKTVPFALTPLSLHPRPFQGTLEKVPFTRCRRHSVERWVTLSVSHGDKPKFVRKSLREAAWTVHVSCFIVGKFWYVQNSLPQSVQVRLSVLMR